MSNIILLLGPSGIGKTTVVKQFIKRVKSVKSLVLDNITHQYAREAGLIGKRDDLNALIKALDNDRQRFLNYGLMALELHCSQFESQSWIVDVGTGFLDSEDSMAWVLAHPSICMTSEPAIAFERFRKARQLDVTYEQYMTTQFSKPRVAIYNKAAIVIKTDGLDEVETAQRFGCTVLGMLPNGLASKALKEWLD